MNWQTGSVTDTSVHSPEVSKKVAAELGVCQRRGIELLDLDTGNQDPVRIGELEQLAESYVRIRELELQGRIARIKRLLRDALAEYHRKGNEADAELISDLFFGSYPDTVTAKASELLESAAKKRGVAAGDRDKFKTVCTATLGSFAPFLVTFAIHPSGALQSEPLPQDDTDNDTSRVTIARNGFKPGLLIGSGAAMLLVIAAVFTTWALTHEQANGGAPSGNGVPGGIRTSPPTTNRAVPPNGKTYTEQQGHLGSIVVSDPSSLSQIGRIQPLQTVQVSCKVLNPSMGTVSPDGYWYRLASPPWNHQEAYAIANTFLNGDPVVGTSNGPQHNTDFNVPDCPAI